jgi:hypothetical protein
MSGSGAAVYGIFRDEFPVTTLFSGCITWEGKL